ncbi:hypothetical protein KC669_02545 [Candidatus Dojkabacteria bacterium]|uniref:Alpha-2-macroglobulin domain-containing protein n=1 Tax=Candidatus Dojkabacteria bacterium TaxID=2099670 RepID=A0A955RM11_9BACT|nr:hypothetical protein [Candidatus Dojkabacteria bacterium]
MKKYLKDNKKSLIEELKNIKSDEYFNLDNDELNNLLVTIEEKADKEEDKKIFGFINPVLINKLSAMFMQDRLMYAAFATFFILLGIGGVMYQLLPNVLTQNDKFAVVSTYPNLETPPHPVAEPLEIIFNKKDIDLELLAQNIDLEPDAQFTVAYDEDDSKKILVEPIGTFEPNIQYKVTILAGNYGQDYVLEEDYEYYFLTQSDYSNSLSWYTMFWVDSFYNEEHNYDLDIYDRYIEDMALPSEPQNVDITVYKTNQDEALRAFREYSEILGDSTDDYMSYYNQLKSYNFELNKETAEELSTVNTDVTKSKYLYNINANLEFEEEGVYFVEVKAFGRVIKDNFILINKYGVQVRTLGLDHLIFAQNFKDSEKISGVSLETYFVDENTGFTKSNDLTTDNNGQAIHTDTLEQSLDLVVGRYNNELTLASAHNMWSSFVVSRSSYVDTYRTYNDRYFIITDRNLYKPGESIKYKVISRTNENDTLVPKTTPADLYVDYYNSEYQTLQKDQLAFNGNGEYWGEVSIPENINTSNLTFRIQLSEDRKYEGYKSVNIVDFDKPEYQFDVSLDKDVYQNGDEVTVEVTGTQYDGTLLRNTTVSVRAKSEYLWYKTAQEYGVCKDLYQDNYWGYYNFYDNNNPNRLNYNSTQNIELDNNGKATVKFKLDENTVNFPAELSITASIYSQYGSSSVSTTGALFHPSELYIKSYMNDDYISVDDESFLNIELLDQNCNNVSERSGKYSITKVVYNDDYTKTETGYKNADFTTNNFGKYEEPIAFDESAVYFIATQASVRTGNVNDKNSVWVYDTKSSSSYYRSNNNDSIAIDFDKDEYNVGDVAIATVYHPGFAGDLWLTINRNFLHDNRVIDLNGYSTQIEIPIKKEYVPKAQLEIGLFSNNKYFSTSREISINPNYKTIDIGLKTDTDSYKPGDEVTLNINTSNLGNPISSNVTVAVIDKAVLDLENNKDYWGDSSIFARLYPEYHRILYGNDSLETIDFYADGGGAGGGGGEPRINFVNTAYWNPNITTDASGNAQVKFIIPDSLTTWAIKAWATTGVDTKVGENGIAIQTAKDLKIQTFTPDQIFEGDIFEQSATVYNNTEVAQNLSVKITLPNGISLVSGELSQPANIPAGGKAEVRWKYKGERVGNNYEIKIETVGGSEYDGIISQIDVLKKTYLNVKSQSKFGNTKFTFIATGEGDNKLKVDTVNSMADLTKSFTYTPTKDRFYQSVAERVVISARDFRDNEQYLNGGADTIAWYDTMLKPVADYITLQPKSSTGGYGRSNLNYDADSSDTLMKMAALGYVTEYGHTEYKDDADNALNWLNKNAQTLDEKALVLYTQADFYPSSFDMNTFNSLYGQRGSLSDTSIALMAVSAMNQGKTTEANVLIEDLISRAVIEVDRMHWKTGNAFGQYNIDANAAALYALSKSGKVSEAEKTAAWVIGNGYMFNHPSYNISVPVFQKGLIAFGNLKGNNHTTGVSIILNGETVSTNTYFTKNNLEAGTYTVEIAYSGGQLGLSSISFSEDRLENPNYNSNTLGTELTLRSLNGDVINTIKKGEFAILTYSVSANTRVPIADAVITLPAGFEIINYQLNNGAPPQEIITSPIYSGGNKYFSSLSNGKVRFRFNPTDQNTVNLVIPVVARNSGSYTLGPANIVTDINHSIWENTSGSVVTVIE